MGRGALLLAAALLAGAAPADAQRSDRRVSRGVTAYEALDLATAVAAFDSALAGTLSAGDRERALMYLGAAHALRSRQAEAVRAFQQLVVLAPGYRPDSLAFPARIRRVFDEARATTKAVTLIVPRRRTFAAGRETVPVTLLASSPHLARVEVLDDAGGIVRALYDGDVGESLRLSWNGLTESGAAVTTGAYTLQATSLVTRGIPVRGVRLPLSIGVEGMAPLPLPEPPPDSIFLPERTTWTRALAFLGVGAVIGALLIEPAATGDLDGEGTRVALGIGAIGAGIIGAAINRGGRPIPGNIFRNQVLREDFERRLAQTRAENARRADATRLTIEAGEVERFEEARRR